MSGPGTRPGPRHRFVHLTIAWLGGMLGAIAVLFLALLAVLAIAAPR